jgi:dihydroflavonol-4-reductase
MARVFVLGATGHVGNVVTRALLRDGHDVVACARDPHAESLRGVEAERLQLDVLKPETLDFTGADAVIFAAGLAAVGPLVKTAALRAHAEGAPNAARATRDAGARFVFVSSAVIFASSPGAPIDETAPLREPRTRYERVKQDAERALEELEGLDLVRVYPSGILGPFDFGPSPLGQGLRLFWRRILPVVVRGAFDFVDVRDVADAIAAAATKEGASGRYLLTGQTLTARELFSAAAAVRGRMAPPALPWGFARAAARGLDVASRLSGVRFPFTHDAVLVLNDEPTFESGRARAELDYSPRDVKTRSIPDLHAFFVREGMLRP